MKKPKNMMMTTIMWFFLYLFIMWFALMVATNYQEDMSIIDMLPTLIHSFDNPYNITINEHSLKYCGVFTLLYGVGVSMYYSSEAKRRIGEEHGSASFANPKAVNKQFSQNKLSDRLFTQNVGLGMNARKHRRNLNTIVIGGSGAGKTRFYAKPNIMQCNSSFVITDPKGETLASLGNLLLEKGYNIRILDLVDFNRSDGYNPFDYIRDDKDVIKLINNLIRNTTPKGSSNHDPFWEKSETALLQALMFYLISEAPKEEQNFSMVMTMLEYAEVKEEQEDHISPLDLLFMALEVEKPNCIACKQYSVFKQASGKTAKSILVSTAVRLATFNLEQIKSITDHDEMSIQSLGEEKTALFAIIPDNDTSFNYLVGMLYTQIFIELYYQADKVHGGRLPTPVHFVLDEFANVALPEDFEKCLATMRSREIYASIIIQNLAQLKDLFKGSQNTWETILGNCDSLLYLGGNEQSTHKYISELLGKETIQTRSYGHSKGRNGSYTTNKQYAGRELLTQDEVRLIDNDYALLFIRGAKAIWDKKYYLLGHRNISLTTDGQRRWMDFKDRSYVNVPYIHKEESKNNIIQTQDFIQSFNFENAHNFIIIDEN